MKIKAYGYQSSHNGITLQLIPETDIEEQLLESIWTHGHLDTGHPCGERGEKAYQITWSQKDKVV